MRILVPSKRVPDTDYRIRVKEDGSGIDEQNLPYVINPFDAIALEEALRIREASADEVEVVIVGVGSDEYEKELRSGLAMGADRGLLVECESELDPWNVARILHGVVGREQPALVLLGKQAVDDDSNQVGQFLAALLDWPQATFASKLEFGEDASVTVDRETDAGIERLRVTLPCVITVDLRLNEPRYASLPNIMKAKKKPIDRLVPGDLAIELEPRVQVLDLSAPSARRSCVRVDDVDALLARLRDEAKVL